MAQFNTAVKGKGRTSMFLITIVTSVSVLIASMALIQTAIGQSFSAPQNLTAESVGQPGDVDMELTWNNGAVYDSITVYRDGMSIAAGVSGSQTTYLDADPLVVIGNDYTYRVCGVVGVEESCAEVQTTVRNPDYDVIVAQMYKNLYHLSVREWYFQFAPNPTGSPKELVVDGYPAIQDGSSVYIGMANCVSVTDCMGSIYTNVLLLSVNPNAKKETVDVFNQLVNTLQINHQLTTNHLGITRNSWSCSLDPSTLCNEDHDEDCSFANAGLCTSPKAELRRDYRRVVDVHDIKYKLEEYNYKNRFCADGTNSIACNTSSDCPLDNLGNQYQCLGAYPALTAGTYVPGMSTSQWPSWDETLAKALDVPALPKDPINRFGDGFYLQTPASCNEFPGHDVNTCWNERTLEFKCHRGSEVYVYRTLAGTGAPDYELLGQTEASTWATNWADVDFNHVILDMRNAGAPPWSTNDVCQDNAAITAVCGNGMVEADSSRDIQMVVTSVVVDRNTAAGNTDPNIYSAAGMFAPDTPIPLYDGATGTVITDAALPATNGLNIQRSVGPNGWPQVRFNLITGSRDYEAVIKVIGSRIVGMDASAARFGGANGFEGLAGDCRFAQTDRLVLLGNRKIDMCMQTAVAPDNFLLFLGPSQETCDGGTTNYCEETYGSGNYNNEFQVGCLSDCSNWADPGFACGGKCNDGTVDYPYEGCDSSNVLDPGLDGILGTADDVPVPIDSVYSCTLGGVPYCGTACTVMCTLGRPYTGACGDGIVQPEEVCDEGPLNGTVGHCSTICSGYGSFCGDGTLTTTFETSLGCTCDDSVVCPVGYRSVAGARCSKSCGVAVDAHDYTCVQNAEECDTVLGLTSYSCPASTALYCDGMCNRACTNISINAQGNRESVPVYEHYMSQGEIEDYDYTTVKKADSPYSTKSIVWYGYRSNVAGTNVAVYRYYESNPLTPIIDRRLIPDSFPFAPPAVVDYTPIDADPSDADIDPEFYAYSTIALPYRVPVFLFRTVKPGGDVDYYYSRNPNPRTDNQGKTYETVLGAAVNNKCSTEITKDCTSNADCPEDGQCLRVNFYALLGPFQETCGNDIIEGLEECEPDTYQTPTPNQSSFLHQYACGEALTPNACRVYGGYCGDSSANKPFEDCDEGSFRCWDGAVFGDPCTSDTDCAAGELCRGRCSVVGNPCTSDIECIGGDVCVGNGAHCNNNSANCTYCTQNCGKALVPRNYCGDGILNCGIETPSDCMDDDPYTEVCDDGANNGRSGYCNETCTGITGSVCGNGDIEQRCNTDTNIQCTLWCTGPGPIPPVCVSDAGCDGAAGFTCDVAQPTQPCPDGGACAGEECDDGTKNGKWTYTCSFDDYTDCTPGTAGDDACDIADDTVDNDSSLCSSANPRPYCSYSCLGATPASCGDGVIQSYCMGNKSRSCLLNSDCVVGGVGGTDYGPCFPEECDSGRMNGLPNQCNYTCTDIMPGYCGDGVRNCGLDGVCDTADDVEQCDPPSTVYTLPCTDIISGQALPGIRTVGCTETCESQQTECHAFGLKIWSDAVDVAFMNERLAVLEDAVPPINCSTDPDLHNDPNAGQYSDANTESPFVPPNNVCAPPNTNVPYQVWYSPSDVRPDPNLEESAASAWEQNGLNVIAVKAWINNPADFRGFEAVYTSPSMDRMFMTESGPSSSWACSNYWTADWWKYTCAACDPNNAAGTWRRPFSYGTSENIYHNYCSFDYLHACTVDATNDCSTAALAEQCKAAVGECNRGDFVGGNAKWIWGPTCSGICALAPTTPCATNAQCGANAPCVLDPGPNGTVGDADDVTGDAPRVVYCRLAFDATNVPVEAAWNPAYGWVRMSTAGSRVWMDRNLNAGNKHELGGAAWNTNLGWLYFDGSPTSADGTANPRANQPVTVDPDTGKLEGYAWGKNYGLVNMQPEDTPCDDVAYNCQDGFGNRLYNGVERDMVSGLTTGYAWSEEAGWIDFGPFPAANDTKIIIEER